MTLRTYKEEIPLTYQEALNPNVRLLLDSKVRNLILNILDKDELKNPKILNAYEVFPAPCEVVPKFWVEFQAEQKTEAEIYCEKFNYMLKRIN